MKYCKIFSIDQFLFILIVESMIQVIGAVFSPTNSDYLSVVQLNSFEVELPVPTLASQEGGSKTCRVVFIRAPSILDVGPSVDVLAEYLLAPRQSVDVLDHVLLFFANGGDSCLRYDFPKLCCSLQFF